MVYYVEDDDSIRNMVTYTLNASGLEAIGFFSGKEFWVGMKEKKPDLVMLDLNLPGDDGLKILQALKENNETGNIPVIIATARGSEYDRVVGLDNGADDYLSKPFGMMEMVSRVKALLRRCYPRGPRGILSNGVISLDNATRLVKSNKITVKLTLKEFELLELLLTEPGRVFSREELLKEVWGIATKEGSRTVDVHIATLRNKLGEPGKMIETVRGVGYRITTLNK